MKNQIKNQEYLKAFVQFLNDNDQLFHFEDEPSDVISYKTNEALFSKDQCNTLNKRIDEICALGLLNQAFELALEYIEQNEEDYVQAHRNSLTQEQLNSI